VFIGVNDKCVFSPAYRARPRLWWNDCEVSRVDIAMCAYVL